MSAVNCVRVVLAWSLSLLAVSAHAGLVVYAEPGHRGPAVAVDAARDRLDLAWPVASLRIEAGTWELCELPGFDGHCSLFDASVEDLPPVLRTVQSARPVGGAAMPLPADGWRTLSRRHVRDRAERDSAWVPSLARFDEVRVCAERNPVRVRRAEARLRDGRSQRLFLPLVIRPGECSRPIRLQRRPVGLASVEFEYETMSLGLATAHIVVQAR